jgi:predicted aspartyl protease
MILGDVELKNVEVAAIEGDNITFLLGMSTLNKLGEYKISPNENLIIID